ncbi:HAD-IIIA family hydrolase [Sphingobium olei]|uniref:D,D-heptose 1,7-bisphosphate phosphatase n=1 Tax=Sphingobium olei TaxID=420955 RepID=A0ABW3P5Q1_9SPHN|nr:HAD-IIIA family hydrolase [Sphingobium sp.]
MKVVILAGGKGTRLGLTDRPKPMVPVAGCPLLQRQVEAARDHGFTDFLFLTGHMAHVIEDHFGDGSAMGVTITHFREPEPLGTAGAVRAARHLLNEPFVVLYGDTLIDVDLAHMADLHRRSGAAGTIFAHPNDHPYDSDVLDVDEDGRVLRLMAKPHPEGILLPNLVSAALYVLSPEAIDHVPANRASDWAHDVFPAILSAGQRLQAYRSLEYVKDMGTPERLARGEADLASGRVARLSLRYPKPAIFLDRDGVLNVERNGIHDSASLELLPGAADAVRRINLAGIPAICVTNQPDVAKGMLTFERLRAVHAALDTQLAAGKAYLDDLLFCPHHPEMGWPGEVPALKVACACRKPEPGMLLDAAERHRLDLSASWLVGDRYADVAAAHAAGARAILVATGHDGNDSARYPDIKPDHVAPDLGAAVDYLLEVMV